MRKGTLRAQLSAETIKLLPKYFISNYKEDIKVIYNKLTEKLQSDTDILKNTRCDQHYSILFEKASDYFDGPVFKRKDCFLCRETSKVK